MLSKSGGQEGRQNSSAQLEKGLGKERLVWEATGIPVCILVLKKCKKHDDVLFINASEHFEKGKRQNRLRDEDIEKILNTYQLRKDEERYSKKIPMGADQAGRLQPQHILLH